MCTRLRLLGRRLLFQLTRAPPTRRRTSCTGTPEDDRGVGRLPGPPDVYRCFTEARQVDVGPARPPKKKNTPLTKTPTTHRRLSRRKTMKIRTTTRKNFPSPPLFVSINDTGPWLYGVKFLSIVNEWVGSLCPTRGSLVVQDRSHVAYVVPTYVSWTGVPWTSNNLPLSVGYY